MGCNSFSESLSDKLGIIVNQITVGEAMIIASIGS